MDQAQIQRLIDSLAYPKREEPVRFLQDILSRAGLSKSEGKYFKDMITKAERLTKEE
jgi:tRNA C32,U32 (ribose-2'-O)-methylase TrmJ